MIRHAKPLLGTYVEIKADGPRAEQAVKSAFAEIEAIQGLMSFFAENSQVSRLNRGEEFMLDFRLVEVLDFAEQLKQLSGGLFDVAIGAGGAVDLGGIAKGYAVDRAVQILQQSGCASGSVNAGGDLRIFGAKQEINIRHHQDPALSYPLGSFADTAVAGSSAVYEKNPLVNPHGQKPTRWEYGVAVLAPTCMFADAMTKVVRLDAEVALEILQKFEATAIITDNEGIKLLSQNLQNAAA